MQTLRQELRQEQQQVKLFVGKMFIVPNAIYSAAWEKVSNRKASFIQDENINLPVVEIWVTGENSDNWGCHGFSNHEVGWFPYALPVSLLENLKEGDTISIKLDGEEFHLTAEQLSFRYRSFGPFEDVLEGLLH